MINIFNEWARSQTSYNYNSILRSLFICDIHLLSPSLLSFLNDFSLPKPFMYRMIFT